MVSYMLLILLKIHSVKNKHSVKKKNIYYIIKWFKEGLEEFYGEHAEVQEKHAEVQEEGFQEVQEEHEEVQEEHAEVQEEHAEVQEEHAEE